MRFEGFHINGFGLFRDIGIKGLSPNLTIFQGVNESGKSTLLGFIRAVLFGFPDGRSSENPYPPLAGGRHGGNIELSIEGNGHYVVERYQGPRGGKVRVFQPDQTVGSKDLLDRLLMIGNRTLFKNIYAFSLRELQDFETLNREAVSEALHSAGAGIDPRGLSDLRSSLERREADLFKPGGVKPLINSRLSRLGSILKEKKGFQAPIEEYDRMKRDAFHLTREIETLGHRKGDLTQDLRKTEQWLNIRPEWVKLIVSRERLEELAPVADFPSQGVVRLEGLQGRLSQMAKELLEKEEELKARESELQALKIDVALLGQASSISSIQKELGHFRAIGSDMMALEQELALGEKRLREGAMRLGPERDEEMVLNFNLSIATREEVRDYKEILDQVKQEEQRKKDSLDAAVSRRREAEAILGEMDEPPVKDKEILLDTRSSCRDLRDLESEEKMLKEELRHREERLHELNEESRILREDLDSNARSLPFWPIPLGIGAGIVLLVLSGLVDRFAWGLVLLGLSCLFGLIYWSLGAVIKKAARETRGGVKRRFTIIDNRVEELEARITFINNRLETICKEMSERLQSLSFSGTLSTETLDRLEQKISESIARLDRWRDAEKYLEQAEKQYQGADETLRRFKSEREERLGEWKKWLKEKGLDPVLSPDGALETLSLIQSLREQAEVLDRLRSRKKSLESERRMYIDLVNDTLRSCERNPVDGGEIPMAAEMLGRDFAVAERKVEKRDILMREVETGRVAVDRLRGQKSEIEREIRDFMASGNADNEEDFRKRGEIFEEGEGLRREIEICEDNIKRLSGNPDNIDEVMEEVSKIDLEELEGQRRRLKKELDDTETLLDRDKRELARLEERIRQLVGDDRLSELRAEEETIREELSSLAEEWVAVRLAKHLIRMARSRYEKERQPKVIAEAGRFFRQMTLGKYPLVVSPIGEKRIEIVGRDNSRKGIDQLSRGTAEQLYLALRFGFIREFARRSDPLPVIMDEILVNFDLERARATVKGIVDLAGEQQVLFFTCHRYMADLFREVDPDIPIISISGGEIRELPL